MKQKLALAVGAAAIIAITYGAMNLRADNDHKYKVCHVTGNGTSHVIEIDQHAWPAHQSHGDSQILPPDPQVDLKPGDTCVVTPPPPPVVTPPPPPTSDPILK